MRYIIIILLFIITSSSMCVNNDARCFHVKVTSEKEVERFEKLFPNIINNEATYIAYLQKYYNNLPDEYIKLLNYETKRI